MKKILLIPLIVLFSHGTFTYKSKWGYQQKPFKAYKHHIKAGDWKKDNNPKMHGGD